MFVVCSTDILLPFFSRSNHSLKDEKLAFLSKSKTHLDYKLCTNYSVIKQIELYSYPAETFHCCCWGEKKKIVLMTNYLACSLIIAIVIVVAFSLLRFSIYALSAPFSYYFSIRAKEERNNRPLVWKLAHFSASTGAVAQMTTTDRWLVLLEWYGNKDSMV